MPMFVLQTNVAKIPQSFLGLATSLIAKMTEKPEERVMCVMHPSVQMTFGGSPEPCVLASLSSIGKIDPQSNKKYSAELCKLIENELGVAQKRVLIKFEDVPAVNLGHDGGTKG